jgi:deazaflavin-dependent oxidoreductase (nitroreductase family)
MQVTPQSNPEPLAASRAMVVMRRIGRPLWLRIGMAAVLEVPGRQSGAPQRATVIPWDVDGSSYLMSQYGPTGWVRNLRAAGRGQLRRKSQTTAFRAVEVEGAERDRVIAEFVRRTPRPFRRDFERLPSAADHPTFRMERE